MRDEYDFSKGIRGKSRHVTNPRIIRALLIGPQGSGKGTQAKILHANLGLPHISTGDLFREHVSQETEFGLIIKESMKTGELLSDTLTEEIIKERLARDDCSDGFLLDGYPRTIPQAEFLKTVVNVNRVIQISVDNSVSVKRLSARRQCKQCGAIYGLDVAPKQEGICDRDGSQLYQRADDTEPLVRRRLQIYQQQTRPLLDYYSRYVQSFEGDQPIEELASQLLSYLCNE